MTRRAGRLGLVLAVAVLAGACASGQAFRRGDAASRVGHMDEAVAEYRKAVQGAPDNANYKIALERALLAASRTHLDRARDFEQHDQIEAALGEYRQASEYDPSNRLAASKVAELDRTIRERVEAARPVPAIQQMRDRARIASAEPALLNFGTVLPAIRFNNASLRDILNTVANVTGINITYDRDVTDRPVTIQLDGATLEQALNQLMTMNQLSYKVLNARSIFVFQDTPAKHAVFDEQVVRTFYISHADATELTQILSTVLRIPQMAIQPAIVANKTANTITVRATSSVVQILEKIIQQNDKPRAEIVIDVEILEVDRSRTKNYGLNLSQYALGAVMSPEVSPSQTTTGTGTGGTGTATGGASTAPNALVSPPPFNLNTISQGVSTADFYLAVPTAIVRFLESDSHTKVIAKPQLRGAEGTKLSLALGQQIPIVSTSYTPIATGGAGVNPLSSYQYKDVGVNVDMTPFVTLEGDIRLDLHVQDSALGTPQSVAGVTVPSFQNREVTTRLRLRDGESNLLAGLVQQNDTSTVSGFPGAIHVPLFKQLFSGNVIQNDQIEIVMLLTPHIVRTHELTEDDLKPLYIGSAGNLGIGGPPPLIAQPGPAQPGIAQPVDTTPAPAAAPVANSPGNTPPGAVPAGPNGGALRGPNGSIVSAPPGSTPVPGTVLLPAPTPPSSTTPGATPSAPTTAPAPQPAPAAPPAQAPPQASAESTQDPVTTTGMGSAQVIISPPSPTFRVGGGPYLVPLSISGGTRLSTVSLTLTYDPGMLHVRAVQEGSFMRSDGAAATFTQQVNGNRIDMTIVRAADSVGASGTGLLGAVLFDAVAPGSVTLSLSGSATGPGSAPMGLQFRPVTITVQ